MALEAENTIASFVLARDLGADEIEFDVRRTRDGVLVVHHDEFLGRVVDGAGALRDHAWKDLSPLRVLGRHRIPLLDEVLELADIRFQLEIKDVRDSEGVVATVLQQTSVRQDVLVTSFFVDALAPAREASLRTGLICGPGDTESLRQAPVLGVDQLLAHWSVADHPDARLFAAEEGALTVWPSYDPASARRALQVGYAGITSDDPGAAVVAISEAAA